MVKAVHRCSFVDLDSQPISALAVTPESVVLPWLACAREGGRIEIYKVFDEEIVLDRCIPGEKGDNITKLVWTHQTKALGDGFSTQADITAEEARLRVQPPRLFSVGLTGLLVEWDLTALRPKRYSESYGGGIWCMAPHPSHGSLAIGCEDGGIRLFPSRTIRWSWPKSFPTNCVNAHGRILSLAWFPDGNHLVAGNDATTIEKWDVSLGKVVSTMKVEYGANWKTTPIWDIVVVSGNTIASGDGKGNLTLFDGEFGTMLTTFRSHEVDILCLATNKAGTEIYSGGVDSKINRYVLNKLSATSDWSIQSHRRHHNHDTKSLVLFERGHSARLFSGGMDMRLSSVLTGNFTFAKFKSLSAFPRPSPVSLAPARKLLMATYADRAKLWGLGSIKHAPSAKLKAGTSLPIDGDYKEHLTILTESTHNTLSGALSLDGNWVALADIDQLRLFKLTWPENVSEAPSLALVPDFPPSSFKLACGNFSVKELLFVGNELVVATTGGQVFALGLDDGSFRHFSDLFSKAELAGQVITSLSTDKRRSKLLVTLSSNVIAVVDIASGTRDLKHRFENKGYLLPLLVGDPVQLATVDSNWTLVYYALGSPTVPLRVSEPLKLRGADQPLPCITSDAQVVLYDSQHLVLPRMLEPAHSAEPILLAPHPYREIMFVGTLTPDQVVIVERPYEEIMARLPPAFASKLYTGACKARAVH
ncbi:U3 small nucleolar RNA-associated protein [Massospora cicadina]|nr:U3 small nucleolar RNA-associated protein [Massospora cicadina]